MSDTETPTTEAPNEVTTETENAPEPTVDLQAEVDKWKALSRKNEQRAKDNAQKAQKYDEIQEAAKTEQEKLQDQLAQAQNAITERDAKLARLEAVRKYALTDTDAEILAVVPADKVDEVASQLAAKTETVVEENRNAGNRRIAAQLGAGKPLPAEPDDDTPSFNGLVRAVRS